MMEQILRGLIIRERGEGRETSFQMITTELWHVKKKLIHSGHLLLIIVCLQKRFNYLSLDIFVSIWHVAILGLMF